MAKRILIIEDNQDLGKLLSLHLKDLGCEVKLARDGAVGLRQAQSSQFDLVILDLMLPGMGGLDVCRHLRTQADYTPILMLTAKSSELDRVLGLEMGADDYITKPFSIQELLARVKAIFRRVDLAGKPDSGRSKSLRAGKMVIELDKRSVTLGGKSIELTAKEFDLLVHFAKNPGRVYSRSQLLDLVWGYNHGGYEHTVNSHINRLRGKIEPDLAEPEYILTVWGVGYKFNDNVLG
jgi:DNA-binding response OmpR family regulator